MATNEQLAEARQKAVLSPNIGKRGEGKKTITKEELREKWMIDMGSELKTITRLLKIFIKRLETQGIISNADIETLMKMLAQLIGSPEKETKGDTNINVERGVFVLPSEVIRKYDLDRPSEI